MGSPVSWIGKACKQEEEGTKESFCEGMKLDKVRNDMIGWYIIEMTYRSRPKSGSFF
jgi:hypothetical protein